ncbi:sugar phosphate isomerase/epimerase family protein [Kitasatospora sp. NPDC094016]|uniref:sugar phosphate isomerase/epimerase family protein n=1 Tax=Kitasatospora sp. NPDC094016 TaxID=3154986 RepID=UPI00331E3039
MPLALSTLGLPGLPLAAAARLAADHGWHGLELRCAPGQPVHPGLTADERRAAVRALASTGTVPLALTSYLGIAAPGADAPLLADLGGHLELAADLGCPAVRVFPRGGAAPGPAAVDERAGERAARRLAAVADRAGALGVRVLVETHDSHPTGRDLARLLAPVDHPAVGALWDLQHTVLGGEPPQTTHRALADRLGHVQVKDVASAADRTPLPLGAGTLPIAACLALLPADAWVCWEYEAPWYPEAAPLAPLLGAAADWLAGLRR